jgi:hypothetical protein
MAFPSNKFNTRSMLRKGSLTPGTAVNFEEKNYCQLCNTEFKAIINRRHHCRKCGKSVCAK